MGVLRISHVNIRVLDMEASLHHYINVVGMKKVHEDKQGNVYLKCWDEWDKYSLILTEADKAGINHIGYKVESDEDLDRFKKRISDYGIHVDDIERGALDSVGRALRFNIPSGHEMYLYAEKDYVGTDVGTVNPEPWPDGLVGAGVHWLDHALLMSEFDLENAKEIFNILKKQINSSRIIIFATHNRFFANKSDCLLEMNDGNIRTING